GSGAISQEGHEAPNRPPATRLLFFSSPCTLRVQPGSMVGGMNGLASSAQKFQQASRALGLDVAVREMTGSTRTAAEAPAACGVTVGQIVKSLVFEGATTGMPYLLLVSGSNRVDEAGTAR